MPTYTAPGVYVEEIPSSQKVLASAPTAVAAFVGFTERAPQDDPNDPQGLAPRLVTSWTQFEALYGGFVEGAILPLSVYGYFLNGGSLAYIVRVPNAEPSGEPSRLALPAADRSLGLPISVESVEPDANLTVVVEAAEVADDHDGPAPFSITIVDGGEAVESYDDLTLGGPRDAATVINKTSTRVKVEVKLADDVDLTSQLELLKPGAYTLEQAAAKPVPVNGRKFAGSESARTGIAGLAIADDVTIVLVPDLVTAATKADGTLDLGLWKAVQTSLIAHCEQHANRVAILDAPPGLSPQAVKEWRTDTAQFDSAFADAVLPLDQGREPDRLQRQLRDPDPAVGPRGRRLGPDRRDPRRVEGPGQRHDPWRPGRRAEHHAGRAGCAQPAGHQRDPALRPARHPHLGRPHARVGHGLDVHQRPPPVQHDRGDDPRGHPVGRLRAEQRGPVGRRQAHAQRVPARAVVGRRTVRRTARRRRSSSTATRPRTRPSRSTPGKLVVEVGIAPVKPAEFVIFRISQNKQTAS